MVSFRPRTIGVFFYLGIQFCNVDAWVPNTVLALSKTRKTRASVTAPTATTPTNPNVLVLASTKESWSIIDDWSSLSLENPDNILPDTNAIFNQDLVANAARDLEAAATATLSEEDIWINDIVDEIHNDFTTLNDNDDDDDDNDGTTPLSLYDTDFEEASASSVHTLDQMGSEIAMLVRCNEHPEELLISQGRALPPLTEEEKHDPLQLVTYNNKKDKEAQWKATEFLKTAVSTMFHSHAKPDKRDDILSMGRPEVANWMTKAFNDGSPTRSHDSSVLKTISQYGSYGSGRLVEEDFQNLYLSVIVGNGDDNNNNNKSISPKRHLQLRKPFIDIVWRDLRNHGILSPVEEERNRLLEEMELSKQSRMNSFVGNTNTNNNNKNAYSDEIEMDECEILDWDYRPESNVDEPAKREASGERSSHKTVELAPGTKTPLYLRDGDFVFIDEESCIGCMQCANVAPNSFLMLESGRARTFKQRNSKDVQSAVASCPVNCMHPVTYTELEEYESARDGGDGRTDHKHLGHRRGNTPLYVAGIDSDNNHRTSWYHTLKGKCLVSSQCPQKGCYDCPKYGKPGENPYFKERNRKDEHIRAQFFADRGDLDDRRKVVDL